MRFLVALTILTGIVGATCLYVASQSPAYVDETGWLVEPFAWMISGRLLLALFSVGIVTTALIALLRTRKSHTWQRRMRPPNTEKSNDE